MVYILNLSSGAVKGLIGQNKRISMNLKMKYILMYFNYGFKVKKYMSSLNAFLINGKKT